jgi:hypothetical protein
VTILLEAPASFGTREPEVAALSGQLLTFVEDLFAFITKGSLKEFLQNINVFESCAFNISLCDTLKVTFWHFKFHFWLLSDFL